MIKPHKRLDVWNKAIDLTVDIYRLSDRFPKTEIYGLTSQMRRAAVSVPSNTAEGAARQTKKEFINYLHMAQGSLSELDTQLVIANRLQYISVEAFKKIENAIETISKMITGLIKSLKK
ncbi:four helix bundle protein [bacterium]|nr:four helix bundle protein [bacterium]